MSCKYFTFLNCEMRWLFRKSPNICQSLHSVKGNNVSEEEEKQFEADKRLRFH